MVGIYFVVWWTHPVRRPAVGHDTQDEEGEVVLGTTAQRARAAAADCQGDLDSDRGGRARRNLLDSRRALGLSLTMIATWVNLEQ